MNAAEVTAALREVVAALKALAEQTAKQAEQQTAMLAAIADKVEKSRPRKRAG